MLVLSTPRSPPDCMKPGTCRCGARRLLTAAERIGVKFALPAGSKGQAEILAARFNASANASNWPAQCSSLISYEVLNSTGINRSVVLFPTESKVLSALSLCAPGCFPDLLGNYMCDAACFNKECQWDKSDCHPDLQSGFCCDPSVASDWGCTPCEKLDPTTMCSPTCPDELLGNQVCDWGCNTINCGFDRGDCAGITQCAPMCPYVDSGGLYGISYAPGMQSLLCQANLSCVWVGLLVLYTFV